MEKWQVLEGAANLIEKRGLSKRRLMDDKGSLCVRGAFIVSSGNALTPWDRLQGMPDKVWEDVIPVDRALKTYLVNANLVTEGIQNATVVWNNDVNTSQAGVVLALRACAAIEKAKATPVRTMVQELIRSVYEPTTADRSS